MTVEPLVPDTPPVRESRGDGALFGDGFAKRRRAKELDAQPDAQPGKAARQFRSVLAWIVVLRRMRRQIGGGRFVGLGLFAATE